MEFLVNGKFTDEELIELQTELKDRDIEVARSFTKSFNEAEIVRFIFRDLDAYKLLRDGTLFEILQWCATKAFKWVKNKKPDAKVDTRMELHFKDKNGDVAPINVGLPADEPDAWKQLKDSVTQQFVETMDSQEIVNFYWDKADKKLKVQRMKL